jgi:palmitoyl-protein thioesterase
MSIKAAKVHMFDSQKMDVLVPLTNVSKNQCIVGTSAVPNCIPKDTHNQMMSATSQDICELMMEQASKRAYSNFAQKHSFQANYWRDPRPIEKKAYQTYSQLAQWNNEGFQINETLKENWKKTQKFVWVMADSDTMIWPKEGEHWGSPDPSDPFKKILPMNETEWYQKDLFGLKTGMYSRCCSLEI